jgi:DNA-binding response OmpR family regulator
MTRRRVLLVEDDDDVRALLRELLTDAGYVVTDAGRLADARLALAAPPDAAFDLVVVDVMLPDGHGTALVRAAERRGVKSLVVTGNPDRMTLFEGQGVDYLSKPFRPVEFLRRVEACLASPSRAGPT